MSYAETVINAAPSTDRYQYVKNHRRQEEVAQREDRVADIGHEEGCDQRSH